MRIKRADLPEGALESAFARMEAARRKEASHDPRAGPARCADHPRRSRSRRGRADLCRKLSARIRRSTISTARCRATTAPSPIRQQGQQHDRAVARQRISASVQGAAISRFDQTPITGAECLKRSIAFRPKGRFATRAQPFGWPRQRFKERSGIPAHPLWIRTRGREDRAICLWTVRPRCCWAALPFRWSPACPPGPRWRRTMPRRCRRLCRAPVPRPALPI